MIVRAEYALGEVEGNVNAGVTKAVGCTYISGPFKLGASYASATQNVGTTAAPSYLQHRVLAEMPLTGQFDRQRGRLHCAVRLDKAAGSNPIGKAGDIGVIIFSSRC